MISQEFLIRCQKDGLIIELHNLIFQICHIVIELRSSSQQAEGPIVKYVIKNKIINLFCFKDIGFNVKNIYVLGMIYNQ